MKAANLQLPITLVVLRDILKSADVIQTSVFGSYGRGQAHEDSDLDILVKYSDGVSWFDHLNLKDRLEQQSGKPVDVVSSRTVSRHLQPYIDKAKGCDPVSNRERDEVLIKEMFDLIDLSIDNIPKDKAAFLQNVNARDATATPVQAIGEHLRSLREKQPEVPWRQAMARRNIVAHEYDNLDYEIVWQVVTGSDDFESSQKQLENIII